MREARTEQGVTIRGVREFLTPKSESGRGYVFEALLLDGDSPVWVPCRNDGQYSYRIDQRPGEVPVSWHEMAILYGTHFAAEVKEIAVLERKIIDPAQDFAEYFKDPRFGNIVFRLLGQAAKRNPLLIVDDEGGEVLCIVNRAWGPGELPKDPERVRHLEGLVMRLVQYASAEGMSPHSQADLDALISEVERTVKPI